MYIYSRKNRKVAYFLHWQFRFPSRETASKLLLFYLWQKSQLVSNPFLLFSLWQNSLLVSNLFILFSLWQNSLLVFNPFLLFPPWQKSVLIFHPFGTWRNEKLHHVRNPQDWHNLKYTRYRRDIYLNFSFKTGNITWIITGYSLIDFDVIFPIQ